MNPPDFPLPSTPADSRLVVAAALFMKEGKPHFLVKNSLLLTSEVFPNLIASIVRAYILDMQTHKQILPNQVEDLEAKILDKISEAVVDLTYMGNVSEDKLDNPETT